MSPKTTTATPPKGKSVLEDHLGKSVVNLVQHFGLDQADLIYDDEFEVLQI